MKTGIYVFPNNVDKGTLEDLLLERAEEVYPEILLPAKNYIEQVGQEHKKNWSMSAEKKVLFGCMANVLRPGKSNQISIHDNDWICKEMWETPCAIQSLYKFIRELVGHLE